jgi:hypothetical protein
VPFAASPAGSATTGPADYEFGRKDDEALPVGHDGTGADAGVPLTSANVDDVLLPPRFDSESVSHWATATELAPADAETSEKVLDEWAWPLVVRLPDWLPSSVRDAWPGTPTRSSAAPAVLAAVFDCTALAVQDDGRRLTMIGLPSGVPASEPDWDCETWPLVGWPEALHDDVGLTGIPPIERALADALELAPPSDVELSLWVESNSTAPGTPTPVSAAAFAE